MNRARPGPSPVERVSSEHPDGPEWRADAMAQSRHTRLDDVLLEPMVDRDLERATILCAEVTRRCLGDFAPALMLLPAPERRRVQALAAFGSTLFDFARQSSLDGEKLAQINRWHFDLELTLEGAPPGQPIFVLLAAVHAERPWPEPALDALVGCAHRRAVRQRPDSAASAESDALRLAQALSGALVPGRESETAPLLAALLRVDRLLALGQDQGRHQAGLPADELPESWSTATERTESDVEAAIGLECERLVAALGAVGDLKGLPAPWRRTLSYGVLAGRRLVARVAKLGSATLANPPHLGIGERLMLLLRCRILPL